MAKKQAKEIGFEVMCPDCGAMLRIDPVTQTIIAHTPAPRKRTFEDLGSAAKAARENDARRDNIFAQSVEAQKNRDSILNAKFEEAFRKAKETPDTGKPFREFDLD
ncbi:hypothetical protein [Terriglobus sp. RCC_193]|uniref:hypothetical protein n=1 Tax=Terriglobus sp. RCC_193 TaxID=3239218 RepID=UPI0035265F0B